MFMVIFRRPFRHSMRTIPMAIVLGAMALQQLSQLLVSYSPLAVAICSYIVIGVMGLIMIGVFVMAVYHFFIYKFCVRGIQLAQEYVVAPFLAFFRVILFFHVILLFFYIRLLTQYT